MLISQTPLRVSFFGGGTDLPSFYKQFPGRVLSTTIDKFIYVIIKERYDDLIVLNYSKKEIINNVSEINHELIREAMKITGIKKGVEITTLADIPSEGSGLGSSSSLTVGSLNAFYNYIGKLKDSYTLANQACKIEIEILGKPIGKQDQFAASFGGLRVYTFNTDDTVTVEPLNLSLRDIINLQSHFFLIYTGITRSSSNILESQSKKTSQNIEYQKKMSEMPLIAKELLESKNFDEFGEYVNEAWKLKQSLTEGITNSEIENIYNKGIYAGALGGKLLGAGGGGFFLFYVPDNKRNIFLNAFEKDYKLLPFTFDRCGSRMIFNNGRNEHMI